MMAGCAWGILACKWHIFAPPCSRCFLASLVYVVALPIVSPLPMSKRPWGVLRQAVRAHNSTTADTNAPISWHDSRSSEAPPSLSGFGHHVPALTEWPLRYACLSASWCLIAVLAQLTLSTDRRSTCRT
ncbi:hypothetical protein BX600DRAFT_451695 [Xylariales sp. PMI_506]|nr:hypothetical protein BX600DRAFT_451695 [Xylariales sp. PMI_506]